MKKKIAALLIIFLLYTAAFAAAAVVIALLKNRIGNVILLLLLGNTAATAIVWLFGVIIKNSSVYDPYWSVQPLCVVLGFYLLTDGGFAPYHLFALIPLTLWAARLTFNWASGFDGLKWQDWRYVKLKKDNPALWPLINFFGINMMPTFLVFGGTIPILQYLDAGSFNLALSISGCAITAAAAILQAFADKQLSDFKKLNKGKCMDSGLWRYSRHPNYLGEVSLWWGFFIMAVPVFTWLSVIGAVSITLLFNFISIPLIEKRLKERPGYPEYRASVSRMLLLPRKK